MRTLTSRSTVTSYFRSDVDHWRVNIGSTSSAISITPRRDECLARPWSLLSRTTDRIQRFLEEFTLSFSEELEMTIALPARESLLTVRSTQSYSRSLPERKSHKLANHRFTLLSEHRALDQITRAVCRSAGEVLEPRVDLEE